MRSGRLLLPLWNSGTSFILLHFVANNSSKHKIAPITGGRDVHDVYMVDGNTQGGTMTEGDHPPLLQKSTNSIVDIGQSMEKVKYGQTFTGLG